MRFCVVAVVVGCSSPPAPSKPPPSNAKAPVPALPSECFGNDSYVVKRTYDRDARTITESRVGVANQFDVVMDVAADGKSFTFRGGPEGTGKLEGPEWAWTSWGGVFHAGRDGSSMTTMTTVTEGEMSTRSEIAAGGSHTMGTPETYARFACEGFEARRAKLLKPQG